MSLKIKVRSLTKNYIILAGAEFASKVLSALAFAILARTLGPESYGQLEFVLALIFIATIFSDLGLGVYGARELAKHPDSSSTLMVHITALRYILSTVAYFLLVLLAIWMNQPQEVKNLIFLYGLTLFGLPLLIQWTFQGRDWMQFIALASIVRWSVFFTGIFLFVRSTDNLIRVPFVEMAGICSAVILLGGVYIKFFGFPKAAFQKEFLLQALRKAAPIGGSELMWAIRVYFATILLGLIIGGSELGWFSAALRLVIALHAFVWLYFYNLFPSISRTTTTGLSELQKIIAHSLKLSPIVLLIGVLGVLFAQPAVSLFFGKEFQQAGEAFKILIWVIPIAWMSGHYRYALIGYDKQTVEFGCSMLGAITSILLNLILVPRIGYLGAAWALVVSEAVIWLLAYIFARIKVFQKDWKHGTT